MLDHVRVGETATMCGARAGVRPRAGRPARLARGLRLLAVLAAVLWAPRAAAFCWLTAAAPMTFTAYEAYGTGDTAFADLTLWCFLGGANTIGISTPRTMTSAGGDSLQFELYLDAARTAVWPSAPPAPVGNGVGFGNMTVRVYGRIPFQAAPVGSYSVSLTVTLRNGNQTSTQQLVVSANVAPSCVINPGALDFGNYDPLAGTPRDAQGTLTLQCTPNTSYWIGLGLGDNPAGPTRRMANGASRLEYELYSDLGRTTVWSTTQTPWILAPGSSPITHQVYGRIREGQMVAPGAYTDVVQATVNF
jgi:spore coat protein U-like protein